MTDYVIHTTGLTRRYKDLSAVDNLNLQVPKGSIYGFLGPNGAGKTTTIRMLLGLITPSAGTVSLFGQDVANRQTRQTLLGRVGALVEMPALYPHLTGRENLQVTQRLIRADRTRVEDVLGVVNLKDAADRPVKGYSLGMKQRLGLALALLNQPDMLILDEPTNGLDPAGIQEMRELIRALPQQGITVFLSSHLLSEIEQIVTHIGIVRKGQMVYQGTLESLQAQRQSVVVLGVSDPTGATRYLTGAGWQVTRQNGHLVVNAQSKADCAHINHGLMTQGMHVYHLTLEQPSLEDTFLKLTSA